MLTHQSRAWAVVRVSNDVSDQALKVDVTQTVVAVETGPAPQKCTGSMFMHPRIGMR